jgi:hypothetical protein
MAFLLFENGMAAAVHMSDLKAAISTFVMDRLQDEVNHNCRRSDEGCVVHLM